MVVMKMSFGERLRLLRESRGWTQGDLAAKLEIASSSVTRYENDTRAPDFEALCKIADLFGVTTDYLLGRTNSMIAHTPRVSEPTSDYATVPRPGVLAQLGENDREVYLDLCRDPEGPFSLPPNRKKGRPDELSDAVIAAMVKMTRMHREANRLPLSPNKENK